MGKVHVVVPGECLSSIAARYGLSDYREIYDLEANASYRKLRPDPHVILPGDQLVIPDTEPMTKPLATGKRHTITVQIPKRMVRVKLQGPDESRRSRAM
jgi:LysM repeat protein